MGHAAADPVRAAGGTLTSTTRALLLPRLGAATTDLGAGLGAVGAGTTGGELRGDDLVHHRDVRFDAEDLGVELDDGLLDAHQELTFSNLTALRTITVPPLAPGTAPLTRT